MSMNKRAWLVRLGFLIVLAEILTTSGISQTQTTTPAVAPFAPTSRVMAFLPVEAQWKIAVLGRLESGSEFYSNNCLYRLTEPGKAQLLMTVNAGKLFEADRQSDLASRRPGAGDVVQVLNADLRFKAHALLDAAPPGGLIRFQGRAYRVSSDCSLASTGTVFSSSANPLQHIRITKSGMQHVIDRHTIGGSQNAGTSIFNTKESIESLVENAQLVSPVLEANGLYKRVFDAGRIIGYYSTSNKQVSAYLVITTPEGKLVTAYPVKD